jgi:hypothetical protein
VPRRGPSVPASLVRHDEAGPVFGGPLFVVVGVIMLVVTVPTLILLFRQRPARVAATAASVSRKPFGRPAGTKGGEALCPENLAHRIAAPLSPGRPRP